MQYLLSEKEVESLVPKVELAQAKLAITALRELLVGDRCVNSGKPGRWDYCDDCPCSLMEDKGKALLSKTMCDLPRDYSK